MSANLFLLTYPTRASRINGTRTHWALFIPSSTTQTVGTLIQVLGTPFTGYGLEFKRNYNTSTISERFTQHLLGEIDVEFAPHEEDVGTASTSIDVNPRNEIEKVAKRVEVPGVSKEPLNPNVGRRCQEWTREVVEVLITKGILRDDSWQVLDSVKSLEIPSAGAVATSSG